MSGHMDSDNEECGIEVTDTLIATTWTQANGDGASASEDQEPGRTMTDPNADNGIQGGLTTNAISMLADAFEQQMSLANSQDNGTSPSDGQLNGDSQNHGAANNHNDHSENHDSSNNRASPAAGASTSHPFLSSQPTNTASEPFPDYFESCESDSQHIDRNHEQAYNYAISKVVEEVIRFRDVDASIIALPSPTASPSPSPNSPQPGATTTGESARSWRPMSTAEMEKHNALEDMKHLLADPSLKPNIQQRFMAMANMVLRLEYLLFRQHGPRPRLLLTERDLWEANTMADEIVRYLSTIDEKLQTLVDDAYRVGYILSEISKDARATVWVRYRRMANVVMKHLKKPRSLERRLLCLFLEFYDAYIYTTFLRLHNRQLMRENTTSANMLKLSQRLITLWDVLNRAIENYELFVNMMLDMRDRFFAPLMEQLARDPEIWQESWEKRQEELLACMEDEQET